MAYRNFLILGMRVLFGLVLLPTVVFRPEWQWANLSFAINQTATVTRTPTPTETITPSSDPTAIATNTSTPTPSPTLNLTFTATITATAALASATPSPSPTAPLPPSPCPCPVYLPLVFASPPAVIQETEPNDTFSQAQLLSTLPVSVNGTHDGEADTGDVYQIELTAGQIVHITLTAENPTGVQLLAYSGENPTEIVRDFEAPFELTFLAIATGTYSLYVFTPGEANNAGAYTLSSALTETLDANP